MSHLYVHLAISKRKSGWPSFKARMLKRGAPMSGERVIRLILNIPDGFVDGSPIIELNVTEDMMEVSHE